MGMGNLLPSGPLSWISCHPFSRIGGQITQGNWCNICFQQDEFLLLNSITRPSKQTALTALKLLFLGNSIVAALLLFAQSSRQ